MEALPHAFHVPDTYVTVNTDDFLASNAPILQMKKIENQKVEAVQPRLCSSKIAEPGYNPVVSLTAHPSFCRPI